MSGHAKTAEHAPPDPLAPPVDPHDLAPPTSQVELEHRTNVMTGLHGQLLKDEVTKAEYDQGMEWLQTSLDADSKRLRLGPDQRAEKLQDIKAQIRNGTEFDVVGGRLTKGLLGLYLDDLNGMYSDKSTLDGVKRELKPKIDFLKASLQVDGFDAADLPDEIKMNAARWWTDRTAKIEPPRQVVRQDIHDYEAALQAAPDKYKEFTQSFTKQIAKLQKYERKVARPSDVTGSNVLKGIKKKSIARMRQRLAGYTHEWLGSLDRDTVAATLLESYPPQPELSISELVGQVSHKYKGLLKDDLNRSEYDKAVMKLDWALSQDAVKNHLSSRQQTRKRQDAQLAIEDGVGFDAVGGKLTDGLFSLYIDNLSSQLANKSIDQAHKNQLTEDIRLLKEYLDSHDATVLTSEIKTAASLWWVDKSKPSIKIEASKLEVEDADWEDARDELQASPSKKDQKLFRKFNHLYALYDNPKKQKTADELAYKLHDYLIQWKRVKVMGEKRTELAEALANSI